MHTRFPLQVFYGNHFSRDGTRKVLPAPKVTHSFAQALTVPDSGLSGTQTVPDLRREFASQPGSPCLATVVRNWLPRQHNMNSSILSTVQGLSPELWKQHSLQNHAGFLFPGATPHPFLALDVYWCWTLLYPLWFLILNHLGTSRKTEVTPFLLQDTSQHLWWISHHWQEKELLRE